MPASGKKDKMSEAELRQRREARTQHGGESAVRAIREGRPFEGLAAEAEQAVYAELEAGNRAALVIRNAVRLQAATDLYWAAIARLMGIIAERSGDGSAEVMIVRLDKFIKRFGWLSGASLRAWAQVKEERPNDDGALDYEAILAAKRAKAEVEAEADKN